MRSGLVGVTYLEAVDIATIFSSASFPPRRSVVHDHFTGQVPGNAIPIPAAPDSNLSFYPFFLLRSFCSVLCSSRGPGVMPLSKEQIAALKENSTVISFQNGNPKKAGTKAHERFEKYKHSTTIGDAMFNGANWQDLSSDFEKNYMSVPHLMVCDGEHAGSVKRTAPEGTPDREALARSKMPSTDIVPKVLDPQPEDEVSRVEMSPATIALLRSMMRDEIKHGLDELESKFATSINQSVHVLREELSAEKEARHVLEERVRLLEQSKHSWTSFPGPLEEEEAVDKSVVVIGGFQGKEVDEVEALVQELMVGIRAYKEVEVLDATPPLAMATFDSPMEAMKFIRTQKKHATMHSHGLWASENRSKTERMCCKATSKLKKFMIEIGGFEAKNVHASYKTFRIMARKDGKLIPVACFHGKGCVTWMDQHVVNQAVRDALEAFVAELE